MSDFSFMQVWQYTNYMIELLLGELVFLFFVPKRKKFALRLSLSILCSLVISYFSYLLIYQMDMTSPYTSVLRFLLLLVLIFVSMAAMYISFDIPLVALLSSCAGGVALQHIGYHVYRLFALIEGLKTFDPQHGLELIIVVVVYLLFFFTMGFYLKKQKHYENYDPRLIIISSIIILICIGITRFYHRALIFDNLYYTVAGSLYAITCCFLSLFIMFFLNKFIQVSAESQTRKKLFEDTKRQYELRKENIDILNIKFHDLKHQILALENKISKEEIDNIKKNLDIYDGMYQTGIDGLDTILNEKSLTCIAKNISMTFMGDAQVLSFMSPVDIFSLFGNALDNSIEAVDKIEQSSKRCISIIMEEKGDFIYINTINFTSEHPIIKDGLPETTKKVDPGYHGYGMRSIQQIAEKYEGGIHVSLKDDIFILSIYLLKPHQE